MEKISSKDIPTNLKAVGIRSNCADIGEGEASLE